MTKKKEKETLLDLLKVYNKDFTDKELISFVLCGQVKINNETIKDPKRLISVDCRPEIIKNKYVSRGGLKLEKALSCWSISPKGKGVLDAGASTGGFTDCLLQHGALFVHAVDVGYNQLDYKLRTDQRVSVHERSNIMTIENLNPKPDWAVADLSFRSLRKAAGQIFSLCSEDLLIALIKPQFEWINPPAGFDGIIRDNETLTSVLHALVIDLAKESVNLVDLINSPIKGNKGNREFLGLLSLHKTGMAMDRVNEIVSNFDI